MSFFLHFRPLIKSSFWQTIIGNVLNFGRDVPGKRHFVCLKDKDILALEVATPTDWEPHQYSIIMVHGLGGSHKSPYMKRIAKKLYKMGFRVYRVNLRGCGSGKGLAKGIYHGGSSDDIAQTIESVKGIAPNSPIVLMGFSMGANIILKLLGEYGKHPPPHLHGAIAISPPVDLLASARCINEPRNRLYARCFLNILLADLKYLHRKFREELGPLKLPKKVSLNNLEEVYIAPRANFSSALEYYKHSSSKYYVPKISINTKILFAKDDPLVKDSSLDNENLPPCVQIYKTEYGGHIGYVGGDLLHNFRWLDNVVATWITEFTKERALESEGSGEHNAPHQSDITSK